MENMENLENNQKHDNVNIDTNISFECEPFLCRDIIKEKSDNILFTVLKPKFEKVVLTQTEYHEGLSNAYYTIIKVNDKFLMYYRGLDHDTYMNKSKTSYYSTEYLQPYEHLCLAESDDGLNFVKNNFNKVMYKKRNDNNILMHNNFCHNFFPYYDKKQNKFIGISGTGFYNNGIYLFESINGIDWIQQNRIVSSNDILSNWCHNNHFDSHNNIIYNKTDDNYYLFVRHNNRNYRSVQIFRTQNLKNVSSPKEIEVENFNMNNQIYSPCVFEYPNSRYILSMPSTGSDKYKNCDSLLVSSNFEKWKAITNQLFEGNFTKDRMCVNGLVISNDNLKMYLYVNENCFEENHNISCYSFEINRIQQIKCVDNGFISIICNLKNSNLILNYETFDDNGYICVEIFDNMTNELLLQSYKMLGNVYEKNVVWEYIKNDLKLDGEYKIRFNMNNCNLYSMKYYK